MIPRPNVQPDWYLGRPATILVVDDVSTNVQLLSSLLRQEGHCVDIAYDGAEALDRVRQRAPDLILMDVMMPKVDGFEACHMIKSDPGMYLIPVVLVTALDDSNSRIRGLEAGADDFISKPFNAPELRARVRSLLRMKRCTEDLESAESVVMSLALTVEARDAYTEGHCERLSAYAVAFGTSLGLDQEAITALKRGGFLHDVGKIGIPDAVLLKPERLTAAEYEIIKQHTIIGDRLCGGLRSLRDVRPIVRHHHERLDGTGYPDGVQGDDVPLLAQIIGIVDVYDATTTARPYRQAGSADHAFQALHRDVERGWRRGDLVEKFIGLARSHALPAFEASFEATA